MYFAEDDENELNDIEFFKKYNKEDTIEEKESSYDKCMRMRQEFIEMEPEKKAANDTDEISGLVESYDVSADTFCYSYPEEIVSGSGRLVNVLFTEEDRRMFGDGQIHNLEEYRDGNVSSLSSNMGVKMPKFYASTNVSPLEGEVYRIISSLPIAMGYASPKDTFPKNVFFDAEYICKYLTKKSGSKSRADNSKLSPELVKNIESAIERLENTFIYADYTEIKSNGLISIQERLINLRKVSVKINGIPRVVYQLITPPALLNYSLATNNLDVRNVNQIHVCTKYNLKLINIQGYLYTIISDCKKRGSKSCTIYYKAMFRACRISYDDNDSARRNKIQRDKDTVMTKFLEKWVKNGFIQGFEEHDSLKEKRNNIVIFV
jgi:uncharacterized protein YsxB (DUF464 family)